jgi:hypothetical protein
MDKLHFDRTDYSVVVKNRAPPPSSWKWEIYRAGRSSPVKQSSVFFHTMVTANRAGKEALNRAVFSRTARSSAWYSAIACWPSRTRAAGNSCCAGHPLRDPNWLLGSGFCRSRCWLGYYNRIGNRLRNIDRFRTGLVSTNHARPP